MQAAVSLSKIRTSIRDKYINSLKKLIKEYQIQDPLSIELSHKKSF